MKISATDKDTTIIEFTRAELEGCRLTYESLASDTARSREVLLTIISETSRLSGDRSFADGNTAMDILPDGEGGCVIVLRAVKGSPDNTFGIFYSETVDGVIDLSRAVTCDLGSITVYRTDGSYYAAVRGSEALLNICREFLSFISDDVRDEARLDERAEKIGELKEIFGSRASEK